MTTAQDTSGSVWRSLWGGFLLGAAGVIVVVLAIVGITLALGAELMFLISAGFNDWRPLALLSGLVVGSLLVILAIMGAAARWVLPVLLRQRLGARGWSAAAVGALLASALALLLMPAMVQDAAVHLATGESIASRAPLAASAGERERLQNRVRPAAQAGDPAAQVELGLALLRGAAGEPRDRAEAAIWVLRAASHPLGFEARMLLAVDVSAAPVPREGRQQTADDASRKIEALQRLRPDLPPDWHPALLGTMGELRRIRYGGDHPDDQALRDTLVEAGRAGSRAFSVLAAELDEGSAFYYEHERTPRLAEADVAWRRALDGYASVGAVFEVARLRDEALPDRLRSLPVPAAGTNAPAPDPALSQRLWRFAWALDADDVRERATPGQRDLASAVALLAMERAPEVTPIAALNPARRWAEDPWALGRWLLALRHARGDCLAALLLSDATRQRRRPAVVNRGQPPASSLDMAWALAWAEAGERCVRTDDERHQARQRRAHLDYLTFKPEELESARAGVAATIAALR